LVGSQVKDCIQLVPSIANFIGKIQQAEREGDEPDLVAAATGVEEEEVMDILQALRERGVTVDTGSGQGGLGSLEEMDEVVNKVTTGFQNFQQSLVQMEEGGPDFGQIVGGLFEIATPVIGHITRNNANNGGCKQQ
jgi:hypothetical protein